MKGDEGLLSGLDVHCRRTQVAMTYDERYELFSPKRGERPEEHGALLIGLRPTKTGTDHGGLACRLSIILSINTAGTRLDCRSRRRQTSWSVAPPHTLPSAKNYSLPHCWGPKSSVVRHSKSGRLMSVQGQKRRLGRGSAAAGIPPIATKSIRALNAVPGQKGISQHLDDSHDYVRLNFGSNLAAAMFVRNRGCDVVGCSFQFSRFSGLDFVAKKSSLTIGNGRKAR